jgi:hypothetical protein
MPQGHVPFGERHSRDGMTKSPPGEETCHKGMSLLANAIPGFGPQGLRYAWMAGSRGAGARRYSTRDGASAARRVPVSVSR